MVHKEIAKIQEAFGDLEVEVFSNKWYFAPSVKEDFYSKKILFSKKEDKTDYFWDDVKVCFQEFDLNFDLICVVPQSKRDSFSLTLCKLAEKLSSEFNIPFENIIERIKEPQKKMTDCSSATERLKVHKDTFNLSRSLNNYEKNILLLDDIKAHGETKLLCARLLMDEGAEIVKAICLGINTTDSSKSN